MNRDIILREKDIARFRAKVGRQEENGCWPWTAYRLWSGYGRFCLNRRAEFAHRVAYVLATGEQPGELDVMHSCDNRACVNPQHLSLGTRQDNLQDAAQKGRTTKGEKNRQAKLTEPQVIAILEARRGGRTQQSIADEFGVSPSLIGYIDRGERWGHLSGRPIWQRL